MLKMIVMNVFKVFMGAQILLFLFSCSGGNKKKESVPNEEVGSHAESFQNLSEKLSATVANTESEASKG